MRCKECVFYHKENNTCQSKKCAGVNDGRITWIDILFCKPCKANDKEMAGDTERHFEETIITLELAISEVEWNYPLDITVALETAIEALNKQIAKKIIEQTEEDREFIDYICPNCKTTLQQKMKSCFAQRFHKTTVYKYRYCLHCGQALWWGETK